MTADDVTTLKCYAKLGTKLYWNEFRKPNKNFMRNKKYAENTKCDQSKYTRKKNYNKIRRAHQHKLHLRRYNVRSAQGIFALWTTTKIMTFETNKKPPQNKWIKLIALDEVDWFFVCELHFGELLHNKVWI